MENKEFGTDQAFAIPSYRDTDPGSYDITNNQVIGLSKREYAAIHLGVSDSGLEWMDEMINKSNHFKASCAAMQGIMGYSYNAKLDHEDIMSRAERTANGLLKQQTK